MTPLRLTMTLPAMLRTARVDEVDIELVRSGGTQSPPAFDDLSDRIRGFLDDGDALPYAVHAPPDTGLSFHVGLLLDGAKHSMRRLGDHLSGARVTLP